VKYTQLAAADKNAAGDGGQLFGKTVQPQLVSRKEKRLIWDCRRRGGWRGKGHSK